MTMCTMQFCRHGQADLYDWLAIYCITLCHAALSTHSPDAAMHVKPAGRVSANVLIPMQKTVRDRSEELKPMRNAESGVSSAGAFAILGASPVVDSI